MLGDITIAQEVYIACGVMDQVTLVKNQVRAQSWYKLIGECQSSGQIVVSWCKENDINIKTYYYWLRKFIPLFRTQGCCYYPHGQCNRGGK